jgi:mitogen-activated protein kinase 1/3
MEKCLTFSPKRRIDVGEALKHPYLLVRMFPSPLACQRAEGHMQPYHDPQDEPLAKPLETSFFDFDNGDPLGKEDLKGMIYVLKCLTYSMSRTVLIYNEVTRSDNGPSSFLLVGPP